MNNLSRSIIHAKVDSIPGILSVLEENLIANQKQLPTHILEQNGFLIHSFTADDAKAAILNKDHFIVLISTENTDIIGYTIGCNISRLKKDFQDKLAAVSSEINDIISSQKSFYHRHIAKKLTKKNVGTQLLEQLITETKHMDYKYIICQIAHEPFRNKASIALHQKLGFEYCGCTQNENLILGVYLKKL